MGCSLQTASKPQETTAPQKVEAKQGSSKATPSTTQASSLEALQKGTLGKGAEEGPLRDVNFDFDRYDLRPDAREILKVTLHGSTRILKSGSRSKGIVMSVEPASITSHWELKEQEAQSAISSIWGSRRVRCRPLATVKIFLSAGSRMRPCWAKNRRAHFVVKAGPTA